MMFRFRSPFRRRVLLVLLSVCLSAWAAALVEATNARYVTRKTGAVSVRVASFLFEADPPVMESPDEVVDCNLDGDRVSYAFTIRNRSEVAVEYAVRAEGVPEALLLTMEGEAGTLPANGAETTVRLSFSARDPFDRHASVPSGETVFTVTALQKGGGND